MVTVTTPKIMELESFTSSTSSPSAQLAPAAKAIRIRKLIKLRKCMQNDAAHAVNGSSDYALTIGGKAEADRHDECDYILNGFPVQSQAVKDVASTFESESQHVQQSRESGGAAVRVKQIHHQGSSTLNREGSTTFENLWHQIDIARRVCGDEAAMLVLGRFPRARSQTKRPCDIDHSAAARPVSRPCE
jgi:hypothetical protein